MKYAGSIFFSFVMAFCFSVTTIAYAADDADDAETETEATDDEAAQTEDSAPAVEVCWTEEAASQAVPVLRRAYSPHGIIWDFDVVGPMARSSSTYTDLLQSVRTMRQELDSRVQFCFERYFSQNGHSSAPEEVVAVMLILPSGFTRVTVTESSIDDPSVGECLVERVLRARPLATRDDAATCARVRLRYESQ